MYSPVARFGPEAAPCSGGASHSFSPQHRSLPVLVSTHVCSAPTATCATCAMQRDGLLGERMLSAGHSGQGLPGPPHSQSVPLVSHPLAASPSQSVKPSMQLV